jgi:UDP-3-O-[3-hydroxymyristoyl] glucosamine N-acyltransferase
MYTIERLAKEVEGEVVGNPDQVIQGFSPANEAREGEITFLAFPKYLPAVLASKASCVIVPKVFDQIRQSQIVVKHPYYAFIRIIQLFQGKSLPPSGISPKAEILKNVKIGENPSIGPFVFIDEEVTLGDRATLYPGVYIGKGSSIGDDALIYSNVSIREKTKIGKRAIIHDGAVIGSDGFGFVTVDGVHHKVPQLGIAVLEDDIEVGANVTIDRATFGETRIKKGTKLDNQVHLGHNVVVGEHSLLAAQTGSAGSVEIGDYVVTGGQAGFSGHIKVGNHVTIAGKSGVTHDIPDGQTVAGFPAVPHLQWKRSMILLSQLSKIQKQVQSLEKQVQALEEKIKRG